MQLANLSNDLTKGESTTERPLVRLLVGSGIAAMPHTTVTTIYASGRYEGPDSQGLRSPEETESFRIKLEALGYVTQRGMEKEIEASGLPTPSMRNDSVLYGLEMCARRARHYLYLRSPNVYRGKGLNKVDTFLRILDEVAKFSDVYLRG
jgi:hypothetical protein